VSCRRRAWLGHVRMHRYSAAGHRLTPRAVQTLCRVHAVWPPCCRTPPQPLSRSRAQALSAPRSWMARYTRGLGAGARCGVSRGGLRVAQCHVIKTHCPSNNRPAAMTLCKWRSNQPCPVLSCPVLLQKYASYGARFEGESTGYTAHVLMVNYGSSTAPASGCS
jgi:hypothetical protein